jgi:hypothetical protein
VIETLKEVDKDRKCFRMVGGVLVERTVNEVLPALEQNKDQVEQNLEKKLFFQGFNVSILSLFFANYSKRSQS